MQSEDTHRRLEATLKLKYGRNTDHLVSGNREIDLYHAETS